MSIEIIIALCVCVFFVIIFAFAWYKIVPANEAHVVIKRGKTRVFSGHKEYSTDGKAAYFEIPRMIPYFGTLVHRMPLSMVEINVKDFLAFDRDRVRFECDIAAYLIIDDPLKAAQRFPGGLDELQSQIFKIIKASSRDTTTKLTIREIINERETIALKIQKSLQSEVLKWGMRLQAIELINLQDPHDGSSTVIHDISSIAEVQINSEARQKNAEQVKQARLKEAVAEQDARSKEIEKEQILGVREEEKNVEIAKNKQKVSEETMKVKRIENVRLAEIERDAAIEKAEGERQSVIKIKMAEAEGIKSVGAAEAEAKSKLADALKKINDAALDVRNIEKDEKIGIEAARALQNAEIKFINAGKPTSILDLFSPTGGANIGGMIDSLKATSPETYGKITDLIAHAVKPKTSDAQKTPEDKPKKDK